MVLGITSVMSNDSLIPDNLITGSPIFSWNLGEHTAKLLKTLGYTGILSVMNGSTGRVLIPKIPKVPKLGFGVYSLVEEKKEERPPTLPYAADVLVPAYHAGDGASIDDYNPLLRELPFLPVDEFPQYYADMRSRGIRRVVLTKRPFYAGNTLADGYRSGDTIKIAVGNLRDEREFRARLRHELDEDSSLSHPEVCDASIYWARQQDPEIMPYLMAYKRNLH